MLKNKLAILVGAFFLVSIHSVGLAKLSQEEIARLDKDLTPMGGIRAGNEDGSIPLMKITDTGVVKGVSNLNPFTRTEAETICWESGIETEICSEGGMNVCDVNDGDYIKVKGVDFGSGATSFEARIASATSGGNIEIRLDSLTGTLIGTCAVSGTGDWQTW